MSFLEETNALTSCIHMFFKLVGWDFAESGAKAPDFAEMFQALGVVMNVSALHGGLATKLAIQRAGATSSSSPCLKF